MTEGEKCSLENALRLMRRIIGCTKTLDGKRGERKCKVCKYNPLNK
ncbi:hypothetical protein LCGC14_0567130 [marine sediment metagenome]|uniref:Uncharacterized protein n=1 Tax=marine sediment metagenome TaxID=412755 RepID=A0A0F9U6R3_9ZZZZ